MKTMTTEEWKADELPNGGVELTKKERAASYRMAGVLGGPERMEIIDGHGHPISGAKIVIAREDRCALAHLLAGNDADL